MKLPSDALGLDELEPEGPAQGQVFAGGRA
jgi:hypothetical protein